MSSINSIKSVRPRTVNATGLVRDQEETIYVCPQNCRAHMNLLYITNTGAASTDVDVEWNRADGSHAHILGSKNLSSSEFIQWSGAYIVFEPGDTLVFIPSGSNDPHVDVFATVEEFFIPVG
jgi:hypothetical protein